MNDVNRGLFVVGTGRCGSTFLSQALAAHGALLSLSEFFTVLGGPVALSPGPLDGAALWQFISTPQLDICELLASGLEVPELTGAAGLSPSEALRLPPLRLAPLADLPAAPALLHELAAFVQTLPEAAIGRHYHAIFGWLCRRLGHSLWIERSGASLDYLELMLQAWPEAKVVHLVRNGVECALSMSRHPFFRIKLARLLTRDPTLSVSACLRMQIAPQRFGALWSAQIIRGERLLQRLPPERVLRIRFDALVAKPERELTRLLGFLAPGLEARTAWLHHVRDRVRVRASARGCVSELEWAAIEKSCEAGTRALALSLSGPYTEGT